MSETVLFLGVSFRPFLLIRDIFYPGRRVLSLDFLFFQLFGLEKLFTVLTNSVAHIS